jgi:hypothetical protein
MGDGHVVGHRRTDSKDIFCTTDCNWNVLQYSVATVLLRVEDSTHNQKPSSSKVSYGSDMMLCGLVHSLFVSRHKDLRSELL